jgi:hypothetical protein
MTDLGNSNIQLQLPDSAKGDLALRCPTWPAFQMHGLHPAVRCDQISPALSSFTFQSENNTGPLKTQYVFAGTQHLAMEFHLAGEAAIDVRSTFRNASDRPIVLNKVAFLQTGPESGNVAFGAAADQIRVFEQSNYTGRIRRLTGPTTDQETASSGEPNTASQETRLASDFVSVAYDRMAPMAFLSGFITSERWIGRIKLSTGPQGLIRHWRLGFDGGDLRVNPGEEITLETFILAFGADPWALLERYADAAAKRHPPQIPAHRPVSWCSWYPFRLSVTEQRVLRNAEIAARRLKPLGLDIIEVDLGWQKDNLPCTFEENERFPHGLKWLSDQLQHLGVKLGVWSAPYTISEFDPLSREHPEWLVQGPDGTPYAYWEWFWEPHGKVYILDLTHPEARHWLKEKMASLHARGVRYLKADFIGCVSSDNAKARHDPHIAAGEAYEAARMAAAVISAALPDALILNCGGPETPGTGHWPLIYVCDDTGNTGFISHRFQQTNLQTIACHLFKNRRWGIVQPSVLCVGLPGTLEDARIRATVAFMAGGQIDISDDLTVLPEDRWAVLQATLPPLGRAAKPVDLFDPIDDGATGRYDSMNRGEQQRRATGTGDPKGTSCRLRVAHSRQQRLGRMGPRVGILSR